MALNKKGGFGIDLEEQFKNVESVDSVKPVEKEEHTHTNTHAHTDTHTDAYPYADADIENKTKRTFGLVQQSVYDKVYAYAKKNKTSYNAIVCELLDKFIKEKGL